MNVDNDWSQIFDKDSKNTHWTKDSIFNNHFGKLKWLHIGE